MVGATPMRSLITRRSRVGLSAWPGPSAALCVEGSCFPGTVTVPDAEKEGITKYKDKYGGGVGP